MQVIENEFLLPGDRLLRLSKRNSGKRQLSRRLRKNANPATFLLSSYLFTLNNQSVWATVLIHTHSKEGEKFIDLFFKNGIKTKDGMQLILIFVRRRRRRRRKNHFVETLRSQQQHICIKSEWEKLRENAADMAEMQLIIQKPSWRGKLRYQFCMWLTLNQLLVNHVSSTTALRIDSTFMNCYHWPPPLLCHPL